LAADHTGTSVRPSTGSHARPNPDLARITLAVLFIGGLLVATFWVMQPFLPAIVWAMTLVIATWPLMLWVERHTGNRRWPAVVVMTAALLMVLIVPLWLAVSTIITHIDDIGHLVRTVFSMRIPAPPEWLADIPLVGSQIAEAWSTLTAAGVEELAPRLSPYAGTVTQWFASAAGDLGGMFIHFLLTAVIAAVMYAGGERAAETTILFGRRIGGDRGEMAIRLAGQAVRSVALGVVVTAIAQDVVAGIGLAAAGVPFAPMLTALILILCLIQVGPGIVMFPAVIWMYYSGDMLRATILLVFTLIATTMDQFIRPVLIRRGADLPMLLILAGVIGGLIGFGVLGIFIGPTVLAVAYTLMNAWIAEGSDREPPSEP